jgi:hypothetical protein
LARCLEIGLGLSPVFLLGILETKAHRLKKSQFRLP